MSFIKNCTSCHASLSQFTRLYYCCNNNRLLCRRCRPAYCQICKKNDWKEVKEIHCHICKRRLNANEALKEEICGENYCPRCIAHTFLPYFLTKAPPIIIELRCGHFKDKIDIQQFLTDYCINCGFRFKAIIDIELNNGMKLCDFCFRNDDRKQFEDFFHMCFSCCKVLTYNESSKCSQFMMCNQCSQNQTLIEQSIIIGQSNIKQTKPNSVISQLKSEKMRPHEKAMDDDQPSEQLSIVSRFSAFQIDEEEKNKKKGRLTSMKALSKNSVQIRVQNYKLPTVIKQNSKQLIKCYLCNSLVGEGGTLPNTTHSSNRICKMCYAQTFDKSYLSYTRYNNYVQSDIRTASLAKQPAATNHMKLSMLPPQTSQITTKETQKLSSLLKTPITSRVDKKEAWETDPPIRNPCEICKAKPTMIIRADKKRVCVDCGNKQR